MNNLLVAIFIIFAWILWFSIQGRWNVIASNWATVITLAILCIAIVESAKYLLKKRTKERTNNENKKALIKANNYNKFLEEETTSKLVAREEYTVEKRVRSIYQ